MKIKLLLPLITLASMSVFAASPKQAPVAYHGLLKSPASRAYLCDEGTNDDCQVVPQAIEGYGGFPKGGAIDGQIASGGSGFSVLDEYGVNRWTKVPFTSGQQNFTWEIWAPHRTDRWNFFITKQNWDPNKPLTRDDFDLTPFCTRVDDGKMPKSSVTISCNVPKRTGYQQILGVWEIYDTSNAFYQIIDANFPS